MRERHKPQDWNKCSGTHYSLLWLLLVLRGRWPQASTDGIEETRTGGQPSWGHCLVGAPSSVNFTNSYSTSLSPNPAVPHSLQPTLPRCCPPKPEREISTSPRRWLRKHSVQDPEPTQRVPGYVRALHPRKNGPCSWPPWNSSKGVLGRGGEVAGMCHAWPGKSLKKGVWPHYLRKPMALPSLWSLSPEANSVFL